MATITLRSSKGSPLTNTEVDTNFTNLNNDKYESGDNISVGTLTASGNVTLGIAATVTAAGSTQGAATAITKTYNIVTTASANQGVILPSAAAGLVINVFNISGNTIKVYPASTENIDGGSANAAVTLVTANGTELVGTSTGGWRQVGSGGNNVQDFTINGTASLLGDLKVGVTAAVSTAGSSQGDATALTETFNVITTVGGAAQGVILPTAAAGLTYIVANATATNCKLYPATSDTINGGSANAAVTLPANTTFTLTCKDATDWVKHRGLAVYNSGGTLIN
tara:strand:+ start:22126 stop:22971 length:846 start_codon:yes stop_codon:yes gene_type:complete